MSFVSTAPEPNPLVPLGSTDFSPGDRALWELLDRDSDWSAGDLRGLLAWWSAAATGESFVTALVRAGVLAASAERQLQSVQRGYVRLDNAASLLTADYREKVRGITSSIVVRPQAPPLVVLGDPPETERIAAAAEPTPPAIPKPKPKPAPRVPKTPSISGPEIGSAIGAFRLTTRIGHGPNGSVFEAIDTTLDRRVAIKFLPASDVARDPGRVKRFLTVAGGLARVGHHHLISVLAAGKHASTAFLVTPLLKDSAQDRLKLLGRIPPTEATLWCHAAAEALTATHDRGISHGNLKPSNLLFREDGSLVVCDFGSDSSPRSPFSDIRSLGLTYAWLLAGKPVESADELKPLDLPAECRKFVEKSLALPSAFLTMADVARALETVRDQLAGVATVRAEETLSPPPKNRPLTPASTRSKSAGRVVGKCQLIERVGKGGYGTVYRALHQTLNIPVAVKLLNFDPAHEAEVRKLLRVEARLLAKLNELHHPHLVRVMDVDDTAVVPFLVTEYVEGLSTADVVGQHGRLPLDRAAKIVSQIAEALGAAAQIGIIHGEVKPSNILLAADGTAKLTDTGLAAIFRGKKIPPGGAKDDEVPADDAAHYTAPEVAATPTAADERSDIYSLGATLYHLITGRPPFAGCTRWELILKHAQEAPPPPHQVAADLPEVAGEVIQHMMAKKPADRPATYIDVIAKLARLQAPSSRPTETTRLTAVWKSLFGKPAGAGR